MRTSSSSLFNLAIWSSICSTQQSELESVESDGRFWIILSALSSPVLVKSASVDKSAAQSLLLLLLLLVLLLLLLLLLRRKLLPELGKPDSRTPLWLDGGLPQLAEMHGEHTELAE